MRRLLCNWCTNVMELGKEPLAPQCFWWQRIQSESAWWSLVERTRQKNIHSSSCLSDLPRSSSCVPGSVRPRLQAERSPVKPDWGSPWFRSPRTPSWTCSSIESLTYSNIHSVTRGHRGEDTEDTAVHLVSIQAQRKMQSQQNVRK